MPADLPNMTAFWAKVDAFRTAALRTSEAEKEANLNLGFGSGLNARKQFFNPAVQDKFERWLPVRWETRSRLERKAHTWAQMGSAYMERATKGRVDEAQLVFQTKAQQQASAALLAMALGDIHDGIVSAYDTTMGGYALEVFDKWPVAGGTGNKAPIGGLSKAALGLQFDVGDHAIKGTFASGCPYVIYIVDYIAAKKRWENSKAGQEAAQRREAMTAAAKEGMKIRITRRKNKDGQWERIEPSDQRWLRYSGGQWVFDHIESAEEYEERTGALPGSYGSGIVTRPVDVGTKPYRDWLQKPAKKLAEATAALSVQRITAGKGT